MTSTPLSPHDHAQRLVLHVRQFRDLNEADTRHQIIDTILHDVLSWPRSSTRCEEYIAPGYADYVLLGRGERRLLLIEAKRVGYYFALPDRFLAHDVRRYMAIKTLLTDDHIAAAINQVRTYCVDTGCEHAGITNGLQWIFFRTFARNKDWRTLQAFVIEDLNFFDTKFTEARNFFAYASLTTGASLSEVFGEGIADHRPRFFPKEKVTAYNHEVTANHLARAMRPLVERYFSQLNPHDPEFMQKCYVNHREYRISETNVKQLIHDSLSPYFRDYNVKEFFEDADGGAFGERIASSSRERRTRDVIVLFGGKGCGKSTFVNRLLYFRPPNSIKHFARIAVVNLLECPENQRRIDDETWRQLITALDSERLLEASRDVLLQLFDDRYAIAERQALAGLSKESENYNIRLNAPYFPH